MRRPPRTVILKPAPDTPLAGVIFGELAQQAGFPPGVLNVITSLDPAMAGEKLVKDPRVDLITFTGSTAIGKRIMREGAETLASYEYDLADTPCEAIWRCEVTDPLPISVEPTAR